MKTQYRFFCQTVTDTSFREVVTAEELPVMLSIIEGDKSIYYANVAPLNPANGMLAAVPVEVKDSFRGRSELVKYRAANA